MKHRWGGSAGGLFTLYSYHTLWNSLQAVYINGSVPFGYSLNSGFDTGNDSWFSSGAWQVGTPVQKMPAGTGALWVGESKGGGRTQRSRLPLPVGSGSLERKKQNSFALFKKLRRKSVFTGSGATDSIPSSDVLSRMHTLTYSAKIRMRGRSRSFQSWWCHTADSKVTTPTASKTHNTAWLHCYVENAFNEATVLIVLVRSHLTAMNSRCHRPNVAFRSQGKWYLYVKDSWAGLAHPRHTKSSTQWFSTCQQQIKNSL